MKTKISIIGCGWLGFPLAKSLTYNNYAVKGSTTSEAKLKLLNEASVRGFFIQLSENRIIGNIDAFLDESDIVIVNVPPGLRKHPKKNHVMEISHLITRIEAKKIPKVIYISSTSVFNGAINFPVIYSDTTPNGTSNNATQLIKIETLFRDNKNFKTTIIRFGGLFDEKRHPGKYFSGKKKILNPEAPVNLIHKNDCIAIIKNVITRGLWNITLNAVHPKHPSKKAYYTNFCKEHNLELPEFDMSKKSEGKIIDSTKLKQLLNYNVKHSL